MADFRRYAFLYESADGDREEWETAGDALAASDAVERFYDTHPEASIIKPLRGSVPEHLDLSPPDAGVTDDGEGDESPETDDPEADAGGPDAEPPFDPSDYTVAEVEELLAENDYSEPELYALEAAELDADGRNGVQSALHDLMEHEG